LAKCSSRLDIERKRIEVGFCLLEMRKAGGSLGFVRCDEGANRELRERDG
jgi:hypothetical protein